MEVLLKQIRSLPAFEKIMQDHLTEGQFYALGLPRAARLPVLAAIHTCYNQPILLITDRADHALQLHDELAFWAPNVSRYIFSEPNPLFYENAAWSASTRRERLQALMALACYHLPFGNKPFSSPIIVTSARALMTRTLSRHEFLKALKLLKVGQSLSLNTLLRDWVRCGYQTSDTVLEPGQYSHRGGILDIWPQSEPHPVRLEFFGDEIDTIRRFDPGSQRTVEKLESILISPAREYLIPVKFYEDEKTDKSTQLGDENPLNHFSEFQIPLFHSFTSSILDYLPESSLVLVNDLSILESTVSDIEEQAVKLRAESVAEGTLAEIFPVPYFSWSELVDNLSSHVYLELGWSASSNRVITTESEMTGGNLGDQFGHLERFGGRLKPFIDFLAMTLQDDHSVIVVSRQSSRLQELWHENTTRSTDANLQFIEGSLTEGFRLGKLYLFTDSEIFGWERPQPRQRPLLGAENSGSRLC